MADAEQLWERYHAQRSIVDRNALLEFYFPFVCRLANRFAKRLPPTVLIESTDLANEAIPALVELLESFDPKRKVKFTTYAMHRLLGSMIDAMRVFDWVPRLERTRVKRNPDHRVVQVFPLATIKNNKFESESRYEDIPIFGLPAIKPEPSQFDDDQWWHEACRGLSKTDRLIILMYYREGLTMQEIGSNLAISESRVSQRMTSILHRIRVRRDVDILRAG